LKESGIGATASYPTAISDVPELSEQFRDGNGQAKGGQTVARRIMTLPTHGYVTAADQDRIADVVSAVLGNGKHK
jgi:dTDP-4-amino-4,6-dideoxygalactose transaminase